MGKKFSVVLAGCGGISKAWLNAAAEWPDVKIAGFMDIKEESARARRDEFAPGAAVFTSLETAIRKTGADIVFDCTVPSARVATAVRALKAGCHVLCEKPMAETLDGAKKIIAAAQKSGRLCAVIQNRRYMGNIIRFRKAIESGKAGALTTLNADFYLGPHFGGFRDEMAHVLLLDMAIHTFDAARFISGRDARSVYCVDWNPKGSWYKHGASACAVFEMDDGVIFNYRGSWCAEGLPTAWESEWRAVGERGTVKWDGKDDISGEYAVKTEGFSSKLKKFTVPSPKLKLTGHAGVIREFLNCVKSGGTPQTVCTDNIKSLAMVLAAIESAETGKKVTIKY